MNNIPRRYRVIFSNDCVMDVLSFDAIDAATQALIQYHYENPTFKLPDLKKIEAIHDITEITKEAVKTINDLIGKTMMVNLKGKSTKDFQKKNKNQ